MPEKTDAYFLGVAADEGLSVMATLRVPCEPRPDGRLAIAAANAAAALAWREGIARDHGIPTATALSGAPLLASAMSSGAFAAWHREPVTVAEACEIFVDAVGGITFGGSRSVMAVATSRSADVRRGAKIEWVSCRGILQRLERQCHNERRDGLFILPTGHPDRRAQFDEARQKLNAGSDGMGWPRCGGGLKSVRSFPLRMFGDAVELDPARSRLLQAANLLAHAALFKRQRELGWLAGLLKGSNVDLAYDRLPAEVLNTAASRNEQRDAIVRNG